jgi:shikimate kinase
MKSPVFICGMPGSGKSTIGKKLASRLGAGFVDLDELIEKETGKSSADWLIQQGEKVFRAIETDMLVNIDFTNFVVVSCGGGTPCFNNNLSWMLSKGRVVYLDLPIGMLLQRLMKADAESRPLLAGTLSFESLTELYEKRKQWYEQIAFVFKPHESKLEDLESLLKDMRTP